MVILVALVAAMTLGGASAAVGQGKSGTAGCQNAASNTGGPNYNSNTGSHGNFTGVPGHAWDNPQNAWNRC